VLILSEGLVEDIKSILSTGHPLSINLFFREIVLRGQQAREALDYLKSSLNGNYTLIDALRDPLVIPEGDPRIPLIVLDRSPFEDVFHPYFEKSGFYSTLVEKIGTMMRKREDIKVLTIDPHRIHEGVYDFPYTISSEKLISEQRTKITRGYD
jgi:hypothetical protein